MMKRSLIVLFVLSLLVLGTSSVASAQDSNSGLSAADIARIGQSVVYIENYANGEGQSTGSGTIVDPSGLIYTNQHVVDGGDDFLIYVTSEIGELPEPIGFASLVQVSNDIDFAMLQIDRDPRGNPIDPLSLNLPALQDAARETTLGERIWVFGYPGVGDGYLVVTQGSITSVENANIFGKRVPAWYRTDAEISPGNSGGLVVNGRGEFLGLPTMVRSEERTLGRLGGVLPFIAVETVLAAYESGTVVVASTSLTITNNDRATICAVYVSPVTSSSWGTNQLTRDLATGQTVTLPVDAGVYDISMRDCNNNELAEVRGQDIQQAVTLTYPVTDSNPSIVAQSLEIDIINIEYDVAVDSGGELGFKVYTQIKAVGYRDQEIRAAVFYLNTDGSPVSCENMTEDYCAPDDGITVQAVLTPSFDDTIWEEYWFWIPYSGFPDGLRGTVNFNAQAYIGVNGSPTLDNASTPEAFSINFGSGGGGSSTTTTTSATFTIDINTVEFDESGDHSTDMGIRSYLTFTAEGAKGVKVRVALFFYDASGALMKCDPAYDDYYCDPDGDLTVQEVVTPSYDASEWNDYWIHVPYAAFPKGLRGTVPVTVIAVIDIDGASGFNFASDPYEFELYY